MPNTTSIDNGDLEGRTIISELRRIITGRYQSALGLNPETHMFAEGMIWAYQDLLNVLQFEFESKLSRAGEGPASPTDR
jgi:hypothetical protein